MKQISKIILFAATTVCILLFFFSNDTLAQQIKPGKTEEVQLSRAGTKLKDRVSVAHLTGEARELVYDLSWDGEKGSELIWELKNVYMVGLGFSVQAVKRLTFNIDGWMNVSRGTGEQDNYDWFIRHADWTHWSHSAQVDAEGLIFDINADIILMEPGSFTVNGIVGYKIDNWKWNDYGDGPFVYSNNRFRDTTGYHPGNTLGVTYEQTYETPYLGIGVEGDFGALHLETRLIGSCYVRNKAVDHHHLRNDVFYDRFKNGDMIALDIKGAYRIRDHYGLELGYAFQKCYRMRGDTTTHYSDGTIETYPSGAGAELEYHIISVSFLYTF